MFLAKCSYESYLSSHRNHFMKQGNVCFELMDNFFKLGYHSTSLINQISLLQDQKDTANKCNSVMNGFEGARTILSCTRFIFPVHQLFTGQMFWKTRTVQTGDHATIEWELDLDGNHVYKDWMDISMEVMSLAARIISPIRWLHKMKVYDLGHQASTGLTGATIGLWGGVLALNFVQASRDLIEETEEEKVFERSWSWIQSVVDFLALPFDFGVGDQHPALAITGCVLNIISASLLLFREAAQQDIKEAYHSTF